MLGSPRIDPRLVQMIQRSPTMLGEQGEGWLAPFGGPSGYREFKALPKKEQTVYLAIRSGAKSAEDISVMTEGTSDSISIKEAQKALDGLIVKGLA